MSRRLILGALSLALVGAIVSGPMVLAQAQTDVIKARQENRKETTRLGREVRKLIDAKGDNAEIAAKAMQIAELTKKFETMFPAGSDKGETKAAPAIWTDRAGFDQASKVSIDAAERLAQLAKAGDTAGLMNQYRQLGGSCGACHRKFTTSDPFK